MNILGLVVLFGFVLGPNVGYVLLVNNDHVSTTLKGWATFVITLIKMFISLVLIPKVSNSTWLSKWGFSRLEFASGFSAISVIVVPLIVGEERR